MTYAEQEARWAAHEEAHLPAIAAALAAEWEAICAAIEAGRPVDTDPAVLAAEEGHRAALGALYDAVAADFAQAVYDELPTDADADADA